MTLGGSLRFARYAFPPNALGYCGPPDPAELMGAALGADGPGLAALARRFEGAWPYLEMIAGCNHIAEPLDARVVEAYWVGNSLLDRVPPGTLASSLDDRFARRVGPQLDSVAGAAHLGGVPHHSFHVFAVYPWLGLLRAGRSVAPLTVLDRCRVRWGVVERVEGGRVTVRNRVLRFDGHRLALGDEVAETARAPMDDGGHGARLAGGDVVSLHWDWVCERLSPAAAVRLRAYTARNLAAVNSMAAPGPIVACERAG